MAEPAQIRINISLALAALALFAAAYNGGNNFFKAGQAVQAFSSRVTTIEAKLDQAESNIEQRRSEITATVSAIGARITETEAAARTVSTLVDRNTTAIAGLVARQEQFSAAIDKMVDAINNLALQQGIQTEILQRLEANLDTGHFSKREE